MNINWKNSIYFNIVLILFISEVGNWQEKFWHTYTRGSSFLAEGYFPKNISRGNSLYSRRNDDKIKNKQLEGLNIS